MVIAGISIVDTDSMDAAADIIAELEAWITCPECNGERSIVDYSPSHGDITIQCPCCEGAGVIVKDDGDWDPDPAPVAPVIPLPVKPVRQPLWAAMLKASNGRVGMTAQESKMQRRERRRQLDLAA